jgi:hypothetical protein
MLVRGCKRYIAPTPFALTTGTAHSATLILPTGTRIDDRLQQVGHLVRRQPEKLIFGYSFDTRTNTLVPEFAENPCAGKEQVFCAYRLKGVPGEEVAVHPISTIAAGPADRQPAGG